jgi:ElaB/YqjD/DUF883 family membrane-anchored ribosome-binding protein
MKKTHKLDELFNQTEKLLAELDEQGAPEIEELRERLERSMAKTKIALKGNPPPTKNVKVRDVAASFNHYVQHYPWMALATGVLLASSIGILATNATKRSLYH